MESWQTAVIVVVTFMAGATLPVLLQLSMALRSARRALEQTTSRAGRALDAVTATAERLDRATASVDERRVRAFMESLDSLMRTVNQLRQSARVATAVGAALGPAVGAAVRAWRAGRPDDGDDTDHRDGDTGVDGEGATP